MSHNRKIYIWQSFVLTQKQRGCHGLEKKVTDSNELDLNNI